MNFCLGWTKTFALGSKSKKIQFEFFINKSLKNHSAKNICRRAFCLAPNERELSNLLTLSISLEASIARSSF